MRIQSMPQVILDGSGIESFHLMAIMVNNS